MPESCPLCNSVELSFLNTIYTDTLSALYLKSLGIDIDFNTKTLSYFKCKECDIGFYSPMETGDEFFYEELQKFNWYYMSDKWEYRFTKKYVDSKFRVLEIGSGKAAFAQIIEYSQYTGLEFNDIAIQRASQLGIRLIKQSVEEHSKESKSYDLAVSFQVLEHVPDPASFIRGCVDCLKIGGLLVIAVPAHDGFAQGAINHILDMPPHHVTHWSANTLQKLAPIFGLELITIEYEPIAEYHKLWAKKIIAESKIRQLFKIKYCQLDTSINSKIISKIATLISRIIPISVDALNGHTVVGVYKKIT